MGKRKVVVKLEDTKLDDKKIKEEEKSLEEILLARMKEEG